MPEAPMAASETKLTTNWPELASSLYDALTGRNAEISYTFNNLEVDVPAGTGENVPTAHWTLNGNITVCTRNLDQAE